MKLKVKCALLLSTTLALVILRHVYRSVDRGWFDQGIRLGRFLTAGVPSTGRINLSFLSSEDYGEAETMMNILPLLHNPLYCRTFAFRTPTHRDVAKDLDRVSRGPFVPSAGWVPIGEDAESTIDWIFYVHSRIENLAYRDAVRLTWGRPSLFKDHVARVLFVVGLPSNDLQQLRLEKEYSLYGDILQGDFEDTYLNLNFKAIFALRWLSAYCGQVPVVMKTDDDVFVNIFGMKQHLLRYSNYSTATGRDSSEGEEEREDEQEKETKSQNMSGDPRLTMACGLRFGAPVSREGEDCHKWCLGEFELPGLTTYPVHCSGLAYILTMPLVQRLPENVMSTPYLWIEDVYVTGLLTKTVKGINYVQLGDTIALKSGKVTLEYENLSCPIVHHLVRVNGPEDFAFFWNRSLERLSAGELERLRLEETSL